MASPFAPNCTASFPDGSSATVHAQYHFVIQSYDVTGTIITVDNANYIASTSGSSPSVTFVQPVYTGSGTYTGSFDASATGTVTLHIKLTNQGPDQEIGASPFTITVGTAVPYGPTSTVTFPDGSSGLTNHAYHFVIQSVTQDGTNLTVGGFTYTATVPSVTVTGPTDNGDGTYSGSFITSNSGTNALSIQFNGLDVSGSPFSIPINPQVADPGHTTASGPGVDGGTHITSPAPFTVVTRDSTNVPLTFGGTIFTVTVVHNGTYNRPYSFSDNYNGTYSGSYTPIAPNVTGNWVVTIQIGGTNIVGSPWTPVFLHP